MVDPPSLIQQHLNREEVGAVRVWKRRWRLRAAIVWRWTTNSPAVDEVSLLAGGARICKWPKTVFSGGFRKGKDAQQWDDEAKELSAMEHTLCTDVSSSGDSQPTE